jgi:signal transduction histidine kinase
MLLGQTLIKMGYLDRDTLDRAITQQIIELHAALQESNKTLELRVSERTAELRRALERLAEISQIKANFISNISHELRTPLAQIKGYVELFSDHTLGNLTPEQDSAVTVMRRATDRLIGLIEDLIEFSTASREGLTLRVEEILLGDMIAAVIKRSGEKAGKAGVELHSEIDAQQTVINVDRERLSWVLFQLVDNGIKFTPADGSVTILTESNDGTIEFRVVDTGIGIPPERMGEIFEPFHQLDDTATRRYGGTGLGLALVKIILEAHGSELTVDSIEGKGSTFSFIIPVSGKSS